MLIVGCDPSTKRCALADNTGRVASVLLHSADENGRRSALSFEQIKIFARQFSRPPDLALVEQASGASRNLPLVYMVGVTQAALYAAWECPVFMVPSGRWKKALGDGSMDKAAYCAYAEREGWEFANDDEAAALCIAKAGTSIASIKPVLAK